MLRANIPGNCPLFLSHPLLNAARAQTIVYTLAVREWWLLATHDMSTEMAYEAIQAFEESCWVIALFQRSLVLYSCYSKVGLQRITLMREVRCTSMSGHASEVFAGSMDSRGMLDIEGAIADVRAVRCFIDFRHGCEARNNLLVFS
jgi:hypothetical protein